ncbi:hypothetical protein GCM10009097_06510 [Pigmentiphaga daeguensis]|uniref:HNH endonuclease n=1 Tax=Pigmentiphaga daeguensis TaxID=414049 RepID=A0ABN1BA10_9BURK
MGASKAKRERFLAKHPFCCYCGGTTEATTIDHWPSRAIFDNRQWPERYAFPACFACNADSAPLETAFAVICRIGRQRDDAQTLEQDARLLRAFSETFPALYRAMFPSPNKVRRLLRHRNLALPAGMSTADVPIVLLEAPEFHQIVRRCATKLFLSLHYMHGGAILPPEGGILFRWFTNGLLPEEWPPRLVDKFEMEPAKLERHKVDLGSQFSYSYGTASPIGVTLFDVSFGGGVYMSAIAFPDLRKLQREWSAENLLRPLSH